MEGEDAIGAHCLRRSRHQSSPCLPVSHDCARPCGERRESGQPLPGVRLGQNRKASPGNDPAQTLIHLLGSFAHPAISGAGTAPGAPTLLLHGGRSYNALLLSLTAAASTSTSLPRWRDFSDILAIPCSLSLSVAA